MAALIRYWIEFEKDDKHRPLGTSLEVGVAALGREDALGLVRDASSRELPAIQKLIENVDVSTLDQGHVPPNMEPPVERGIWFPRGFN